MWKEAVVVKADTPKLRVKSPSKIKRNTANLKFAVTSIPSPYTPKSLPFPTNVTRS